MRCSSNLLPVTKMLARIFIFSLLSFLVLTSCQPDKLDEGKRIAAEAENRKVKRITKPMIERETQRVGDSLVLIAYKAMLQPNQPDSCNLMAYDAVAELADLYQAKPGFALLADIPKYQKFENRMEIWTKAMAANYPELSEATVYYLGDSLFYVRPITAQMATVLPCFKADGNKNTNAAAGAWFIQFKKQGIIDGLTRKVKKSRRGRK